MPQDELEELLLDELLEELWEELLLDDDELLLDDEELEWLLSELLDEDELELDDEEELLDEDELLLDDEDRELELELLEEAGTSTTHSPPGHPSQILILVTSFEPVAVIIFSLNSRYLWSNDALIFCGC